MTKKIIKLPLRSARKQANERKKSPATDNAEAQKQTAETTEGHAARKPVAVQLAEARSQACRNRLPNNGKKANCDGDAKVWHIDGRCPLCNPRTGKHIIEWACGHRIIFDMNHCTHKAAPALRRR